MTKTINTNRQGEAMHGYDPVAYFTSGGPTKGSSEHQHDWNGATWLFATADNRDAFAANPHAYAPAFGGHCALGRAMGVSVNGSPKRWRIENDTLFLNKNVMAQAMHGLFGSRIRKLAKRSGGDPQRASGL